jgi:hypothetical protein
MADIIMDKTGQISENKNNLGTLAVDGLIYGLVSGITMFLCLAVFTLLSGGASGSPLDIFGVDGVTSPWQGLLGHLSVSATYGVLFGAIIWPMRSFLASREILCWLAGLIYAVILLLVSQFVVFPAISSPVEAFPSWQWVFAHGVYGLVLGGLFTRKLSG